ncbi:MAG: helix-turn-helix domain-containing protein [Anaerocolumna sp.]
MEYESIQLEQVIEINNIVTIHYFEYMSDFKYPGESHDFWEILCVDKGEIEVVADTIKYVLKKDQAIFHKPNEFHSLKANGKIAPNLFVISFICHSKYMQFFENKILYISENERQLIAQIIIEAKKTFTNQLNDPYFTKLVRHDTIPFATEQLIKIYLEATLIQLFRRNNASEVIEPSSPHTVKKKNDAETFSQLVNYLINNIRRHITIEQICKDNLIGRSGLQYLFSSKLNCGVMEYFTTLKIDMAKQLIRDNHMNFTQIADYLGYSSIHYFSRQFKNTTGMTPSEYSSSIKALSEQDKTR